MVGNMLGKVKAQDGDPIDVEISVEAGPSVMYDAVIVPDGAQAVATLAKNAQVLEFLREQYRHGKPILVFGAGSDLLTKAMIPTALPDGSDDPGLIMGDAANGDTALAAFKKALAGFRVFALSLIHI